MRKPMHSVMLTGLAFLLGCATSARAQITSLSPNTLVFSSAVGTTSAAQTVVLTNIDSKNSLTITGITVSSHFLETNTCGGLPATIAPQGNCTITVQFAPGSAGAINGAITITDGAPGSPDVISLAGTGAGHIGVSPAGLSFGTVAIGKTSSPKTVTLTNNTSTTLNVTSIAASGDYAVTPAGMGGCGSTLGSGASCTENVTFTPTSAQKINGSVAVSASGISPQFVTLTGTGSGTASAPITLTPHSLSFGKQVVGATSKSKTVTVKNTGKTSLAITIAGSGAYLASGSGTKPCGSSLGAGASCTIGAQFAPTTLGAIDGGVSVSYAGTNSPQVVSLSGTGIASVSTSVGSLGFSTQTVNTTSAAQSVKLINQSGAAISISSITATGEFLQTNACGTSLATGASCAISVQFAPTNSGAVLGALAIADGASNSPQIVNLSGVGVTVPRFAYVSNSLDSTLSIYSVSPLTGQLRSNGYANAGLSPTSVTVDTTGRFAYAPDEFGQDVWAFSVGASGGLTLVAGSPFAAGDHPFAVARDPSGRFVYVANFNAHNVSGYTIDDASGALMPVPGSPFAAGVNDFSLASDPTGRFLYTANTGDDTVSGFTIDPNTGALSPVLGSPFTTGAGACPISVAVDPLGRFLYTANECSSNTSAFTIDRGTGALTPAAGSAFAAGTEPACVGVAPSGKFIYVCNALSSNISAYAINASSGALTQVAGSPFPTVNDPASVTFDPSGSFAYATNLNNATAQAYSINPSTGALTALSLIVTQAAPGDLVGTGGAAGVTYTPKFAYVANQQSNNVSGYAINAGTGALTPVAGSPFGAGSSPASVAVNPSGTFAYVANAGSSSVSAYAIDASTGGLAPVAGSPFAIGTSPDGVAVDPSGSFAFVVDQSNATVTPFIINATTGALTQSGQAFATGKNPLSVSVDPSGRFAYVANQGDNTVSAFSIIHPTGVLNGPGSTFATGKSPSAVAVHPTGLFSYVANQGDNTISGFSVDPVKGGLAALSGSPFPAGGGPRSIIIDPTGRFAYVANLSDSTISAFTVNTTTGALTAISGSPFGVGSAPEFVSIDISGAFLYVANGTSGNVSAFSINPSTGALTPVASSPFAAGTAPLSISSSGTLH